MSLADFGKNICTGGAQVYSNSKFEAYKQLKPFFLYAIIRLPVEDANGKYVSIVSQSDLVKWLSREDNLHKMKNSSFGEKTVNQLSVLKSPIRVLSSHKIASLRSELDNLFILHIR